MTEVIRVLCVDDDPDIRTIAAMALGLDPGLEVMSAASGDEALAILACGPLPDVAMLDVMMPGMDGPTLLARIRERAECAALPVIFLTARARAVDIDAYRAMGAIGVIVKPFDPLSLAGEVRALIRKPA